MEYKFGMAGLAPREHNQQHVLDTAHCKQTKNAFHVRRKQEIARVRAVFIFQRICLGTMGRQTPEFEELTRRNFLELLSYEPDVMTMTLYAVTL